MSILLVALMVSAAVGGLLLNSGDVRGQLADSPWPMYHGGLQHGGLSPYNTSHVDGTVLWTFETDGAIESSPTIGADGTIYVGTHGNTLFAVNPDGTKKWGFNVGEPVHHKEFDVWKGILSSPAVDKDGTIYFSSLSDYFFALNPDGTEKWRYKLPFTADTWSSPAIGTDGTIYTGSARRYDENAKGEYNENVGGIHAFNPDGTLKWRLTFGTDMSASPAIAEDGTVYGSTYNMVGNEQKGWIIAANPDGVEKWRFEFERFTESSPTIGADGTIYVGSWDSFFYAINPDGTLKWEFETLKEGESITSSAAIGADGTIYFGARDGFRALNPDGTSKWHYEGKMGGVVSSPAIGADGTVYVGSWDKKLYAFGGPPADEGRGDVESKEEVTTAESVPKEEEVIPTEKPTQETALPEKKGVCGPTMLLVLALLPLWVRRLILK